MARRSWALIILFFLPALATAQRPVEGAGQNWPLSWLFVIGLVLAILFTFYLVYALATGRRRP